MSACSTPASDSAAGWATPDAIRCNHCRGELRCCGCRIGGWRAGRSAISRLVRRCRWSTTLHQRKPDLEGRAAVIPIFRRYQPMVRLDNGARDGQSHAHTFGLASENGSKTSFNLSSGMPGPRSDTDSWAKFSMREVRMLMMRFSTGVSLIASIPFTTRPSTMNRSTLDLDQRIRPFGDHDDRWDPISVVR